MSWFKVDDGFGEHAKLLDLEKFGEATYSGALSLWLLAGSYCSRNATDGKIHKAMLRRVYPFEGYAEYASALVTAKLWSRDGDEFYFNDWLDYNPSKAERDEKKSANLARQKRFRNAPRNALHNALQPRCSERVTNASCNATPDPSRPVPGGTPARPPGEAQPETPRAPTNPKAELALKLKKAYQNEHETRFPEKGAWQSFNLFAAEFDEMAKNCVDEKDAIATVKAFFDSRDPFVIKAKYNPKLLAKQWHDYKGGSYAKQAVSPVNPAEWVFDFHNEPPTNHPMYSTWERMYNAEIKRKTGSQ